ncbi:MAG TPA: hypothetical protein VGB08_01335 [Allosphingosinicella sp.]|jgi:hypothetical protein
MTEDDRIDERLAALFAAADPAPDEAFVARVARAVEADRRLAAARAAAWRRCRAEAAAGLAVIGAFALLWRLAPEAATLEQLSTGPAAAALLLLFLWFAVELRPAAMGR